MLRFEPWKIATVAVILLLAVLFTIPNFLSRDTAESLPGWLPHKQINLGLDLQGGAHLLLEVEVAVVIAEHLETMVDETRVALRAERIGYTGLSRSNDRVIAKLRDPTTAERARELLSDIDPDAVVEIDETGALTITLSAEAIRERQRSAVSQAIEIVRRRVDETGTREPTIQRQGEDRILLQLPGVGDPERIKRLLGQTAKMSFHLVDEATPIQDALAGRLPPGSRLMYRNDPRYEEPVPVVIRKRVAVSGENLDNAQMTFQDNRPVVSLSFDGVGGRKFGKLTTDNVGKRFAIVLDDAVISAPVIREPIPGGSGIIEGGFTVETATDLALLLRAGALPAPLIILEERTVGPSLGADSIASGKIASIIGLCLVVAYMIMSYGLFGIAATLALAGNMALIVALLSVIQATLTLPGIAGIVLTIGMAVDANVLIFERIREEVRNGRSPFSAVDIGFQRALRTIFDANVTTFIAALLLWAFGSGPVKGFGVTLMIGIVASMFTAIMVTRLMIVLWLRRARPQQLPL